MNEVDAGRDCATPASVSHVDDEPLTPISPCYCREPVACSLTGRVCVFVCWSLIVSLSSFQNTPGSTPPGAESTPGAYQRLAIRQRSRFGFFLL
jgi:hypothetical protein